MKIKNYKFKILSFIGIFLTFFTSFSIANAVVPVVSFDPPVNFEGGDGMLTVISVDVDVDGYLDLVTADESGGTTSVFINNRAGSFLSEAPYLAGMSPCDVASGFFNTDLWPDLAVTNCASNTVSVFLNLGDGTFGPAIHTSVGSEPSSVATGDINFDGFVDIVVANKISNTLSILSNDGFGTFTLTATHAVGPQPNSVVVEDLNTDGRNDIVILNNGLQYELLAPPYVRHFSTVSVLLNDGFGTFPPHNTYDVNINPQEVITADVNGDGKPDVITAHQVSNRFISVLINNGSGSFLPEKRVLAGSHQNAIAAADMNNDGIIDLVESNRSVRNRFEVLIGHNDGTFDVAQSFRLGAMNGAGSITTGDYDKDGDIDVVTASGSTDIFGLHRNQLVPNPPIVVGPPDAPVVTGTPDLMVEITKVKTREKKGKTKLEYGIKISNIGSGSAYSSLGGIIGGAVFLSNDNILDTSADVLIKNIFINTAGGLLPGAVDKQKFKKTFDASLSGKYLIIVVDRANGVAESDETNNRAEWQIP